MSEELLAGAVNSAYRLSLIIHRSSPMPRFVLLLHECPDDRPRSTHCDLMMEEGDVLKTWSLAELPQGWNAVMGSEHLTAFAASNTVDAEQLADHRLAYLDYEGPVSGDRGSVRRLEAGTFVRRHEPLSFSLEGRIIRGEIKLQQSPNDDPPWQLVYLPAD